MWINYKVNESFSSFSKIQKQNCNLQMVFYKEILKKNCRYLDSTISYLKYDYSHHIQQNSALMTILIFKSQTGILKQRKILKWCGQKSNSKSVGIGEWHYSCLSRFFLYEISLIISMSHLLRYFYSNYSALSYQRACRLTLSGMHFIIQYKKMYFKNVVYHSW